MDKKGKTNTQLLNKLNNLKYFKLKAPKSLGREWVEDKILPILENSKISLEDKLSTFCEHIAIQIGTFLKDESVLVTGGGTFNNYLIERIKNYSTSQIIIPNSEIIDFKEAIIFAFLGVLKLRNEINCLSSVTGAERDSSGGDIYLK
jgi:anhydro-N-acetylmuramic acid kinase